MRTLELRERESKISGEYFALSGLWQSKGEVETRRAIWDEGTIWLRTVRRNDADVVTRVPNLCCLLAVVPEAENVLSWIKVLWDLQEINDAEKEHTTSVITLIVTKSIGVDSVFGKFSGIAPWRLELRSLQNALHAATLERGSTAGVGTVLVGIHRLIATTTFIGGNGSRSLACWDWIATPR